MVYKEEEIAQVIGEYFEKLFTTCPGERAAAVNRGLHCIITEEDNAMLTAIPSLEEIREAALSIHADKAQGLMVSLRDSSTRIGTTSAQT